MAMTLLFNSNNDASHGHIKLPFCQLGEMSNKYHCRWREESTTADSQYNIAAPLSQVNYMENVMRFLSFLVFE
jgi:hypothetical protein